MFQELSAGFNLKRMKSSCFQWTQKSEEEFSFLLILISFFASRCENDIKTQNEFMNFGWSDVSPIPSPTPIIIFSLNGKSNCIFHVNKLLNDIRCASGRHLMEWVSYQQTANNFFSVRCLKTFYHLTISLSAQWIIQSAVRDKKRPSGALNDLSAASTRKETRSNSWDFPQYFFSFISSIKYLSAIHKTVYNKFTRIKSHSFHHKN